MRRFLTSSPIYSLLLVASVGCSLVGPELGDLDDDLWDTEDDDADEPPPKDAGQLKDAGEPRDAGRKDAAKPKPDAVVEYPRPSPRCTDHEMGDGTACLRTMDYVERAEALCQPRDMYVYELRGVEGTCATGYGRAVYVCCPLDE